MPIADLSLPVRLLAGGGPSAPDPRVARALTTPLIGQFDPAFTAIMDDVVQLGRQAFLTDSAHCFAVSALPSGGLEAAVNSFANDGDTVAIGGSPAFADATAEIVRRCGAQPVSVDDLCGAQPVSVDNLSDARLVVVPFVDPSTAERLDVRKVVAEAHTSNVPVVVEATLGLGALEVRMDDWGIDACVAGVDYAIGAPSGMSLVTFSDALYAELQARHTPPRTSYLDLAQLQAYWSPERLNHHTAPTSLVYGLREALRLVQAEGLVQRWQRHAEIGHTLRHGLMGLGLEPRGDVPYAVVDLPERIDPERTWRTLLEQFGVYVTRLTPRTWRLGLLGADARPEAVERVLSSLEKVLVA
jgi:(S)-ureidoglycine-glyoxylate aminotransferase